MEGEKRVLRGFYTAATGMIAQQRRTEMLTNNMSNASTPGYKADQSSVRAFPEMLLSQMNKETIPTTNGLTLSANNVVGYLNTGVYMQETVSAFTQGGLEETGNPTDIALIDIAMPVNEENGQNGSVFFSVGRENGEIAYMRNGNFTIDHQGSLTTPNGNYVLDMNGNPIRVNSEDFAVNGAGEVLVNGEVIAQLGIAYAENPSALLKGADGFYSVDGGGNLPLVADVADPGLQFSLQQGVIESSNVDTGRTMTDMLAAYRSFEANQKVLQAYDKSLEKAVNEIGRV